MILSCGWRISAISGGTAELDLAREQDRRLTGYGLALAASLGLGLAVAVARFAFEGGTDGQSVSMVRAWFVVVLVGAWCLATGRSLVLTRRVWLNCVGLGVLLAYMFFGNIGAVQFIPVGVAALLFFVYPPLVAVFTAVLDRRFPSPVKLLAFVIAFAGLAVMLGVGVRDLNPIGVAIGLGAGVACAVNVTWSGRVMGGTDSLVVMFHMALVAALVLSGLVVVSGGVTAPITLSGWWGAAGVVVLQGCSIPLYFASIPLIGVERSAIINNLQPVASILFAWAVFAEALTIAQGVGGAMVLSGVLIMQLFGKRA
jgi:DME family drug/metabolite transporter